MLRSAACRWPRRRGGGRGSSRPAWPGLYSRVLQFAGGCARKPGAVVHTVSFFQEFRVTHARRRNPQDPRAPALVPGGLRYSQGHLHGMLCAASHAVVRAIDDLTPALAAWAGSELDPQRSLGGLGGWRRPDYSLRRPLRPLSRGPGAGRSARTAAAPSRPPSARAARTAQPLSAHAELQPIRLPTAARAASKPWRAKAIPGLAATDWSLCRTGSPASRCRCATWRRAGC